MVNHPFVMRAKVDAHEASLSRRLYNYAWESSAMPIVRLPDADISYQLHGQGPSVLLLQGVGLDGRAWAPQVDALSRDHRCIVVDNRGLGGSRGETHALSVDMLARDALAVLNALGAPRVHLVGHSLGGVIVQRLALLAPERVASLTFMCSFAGGRDLARPSARLIWLGTRSRIGTTAMRGNAFARLIMPPAYLRARGIERVIAELETVFGRSLAEPPAIADVQLRALRAHDERADLPRLAALKCLVLSGRLDPIATHTANTALARGIGNAQHEVWDDASHALPIQHADAVNRRLRAHLLQAE
jgi:aminoacrylate hydrolase